METQIGSCLRHRRQSSAAWDHLKKVEPVQLLRHLLSLLLLRINHMLIPAQSNGVNFPTNLRYNIHHSDLQISRQAELLLKIVPGSLRFLTAIWKQVNRETAGDRRRQSPALLRLYGNQALRLTFCVTPLQGCQIAETAGGQIFCCLRPISAKQPRFQCIRLRRRSPTLRHTISIAHTCILWVMHRNAYILPKTFAYAEESSHLHMHMLKHCRVLFTNLV